MKNKHKGSSFENFLNNKEFVGDELRAYIYKTADKNKKIFDKMNEVCNSISMKTEDRLEMAKKNKEFLENILNNDRAVRRSLRMRKRLEASIRDASEVIRLIEDQLNKY